MIFPVTWTGAACEPRRGAGMLSLEFPRHLTGSVLPRCQRARRERENDRDDDRR
jgi:hypothetical protein